MRIFGLGRLSANEIDSFDVAHVRRSPLFATITAAVTRSWFPEPDHGMRYFRPRQSLKFCKGD